MWGLMHKELEELIDKNWNGDGYDMMNVGEFVHKATLRHVYEKGEKLCPHVVVGFGYVRKKDCSECWAELKKEAGL